MILLEKMKYSIATVGVAENERTLLDKMKYSIETMSTGEKIIGSLQVTALGIGIVFIALALLYISIIIMEKVLVEKKVDKVDDIVSNKLIPVVDEEQVDDGELVAVITAAIAASLHTSTHNIIVRNIVRVPDTTPAWGRAARVEQISNMR